MSSPKNTIGQRRCQRCTSNSVDDEIHFLINCSYVATQRTSLLAESKPHNTEFDSLNDKLMYIMSSTHRPLVLCLAKYAYTCFQTFGMPHIGSLNYCYYVTLLSGTIISDLFLYHLYFIIWLSIGTYQDRRGGALSCLWMISEMLSQLTFSTRSGMFLFHGNSREWN